MGFIDLHVHSTASDGTLSPSEVVKLAVAKDLQAVALTDHDTVAGIAEADDAARQTSLEVIPGIELSCLYRDREIHILGYFVPVYDEGFLSELNHMQEIRHNRNIKIIEKFQQLGINFTQEQLTGDNPATIITRAHFAKALITQGIVSNTDQAFKKYLQPGASCYVPKAQITPYEALTLLKDYHGFSVIAHPMQYHMGYREIEEMIQAFQPYGLGGIEVYHSSHNQYESGKLKVMAKTYGLLPTGGSDFHGSNKPDIQLGIGRGGLRLSYSYLHDIKKHMGYAR